MKRAPLLALLIPALACAHPMRGVGDFYAGMLHPLIALDQLLALVAIGLLSAQCRKQIARRVVLVLSLAVVAGAISFPLLPQIPRLAFVPLAATVAAGVLAAVAKPIAEIAVVPIGLVAGFWIGAANAFDSGPQVSFFQFAAGMASSVLLCSVYVTVAAGKLFTRAPLAIRVAGSWLAAAAVMTLALQ